MKGIFMNNKRTDVFQVVAMGTYVTSIWLGLMTTIYIDHVRVTHNSAALLLILIFATGFGLFTSSFNFFGKSFLELWYSISITVVFTVLFAASLPLFGIYFEVQPNTGFIAIGILLILMTGWLIVIHQLYRKMIPRIPLLVISDINSDDSILHKLAGYSHRYQIIGQMVPNHPLLPQKLDQAEAVLLLVSSFDEKNNLLNRCADLRKVILTLPNEHDLALLFAVTEQCGDQFMIRINPIMLSTTNRICKRLMDVMVASIVLLPALPIMIICAIAIYLQDFHSPLFKQERLTRNGKVFRLYKFRTMVINAEAISGPVLAQCNDSRVTKLGHFLRATRLDELPQLFNVLIGDMSIVGPRPEREYFYQQYESMIPQFRSRLAVKAGLTGYAQVWGMYITSPKDKLMMDFMYIRSYSIFLDIKILLETVRVVFAKDAATGVTHGSTAVTTDDPKQELKKAKLVKG